MGAFVVFGAVRRRRMVRGILAVRSVATGARHSSMCAFQSEASLVVSGKRVDRRLPARYGVAILAPVIMWFGRELALVRVRMARRAGCEGNAIHGVLAFWQMTPRACHLRMFSEKRVGGFSVVGDSETGRLPTRFGMTRFAVAAVVPMRKLPTVLVAVAIETVLERDMPFEILGLVAALANHCGVLAEQRLVRPAMIEPVTRKNLLPTARDMAVCARCQRQCRADPCGTTRRS
jgi:hypothetical protein